MDSRDLRNLGRKELMDMVYEYQKREVHLQNAMKTLTNKLEAKEIQIEKAGSIAEASLALNSVFEAAQAAADQYLLNIKKANEKASVQADAQAQEIIMNAKKEAAAIAQKGKEAYRAWVEKGEAEYIVKISKADEECGKIYNQLKELEAAFTKSEKKSQKNIWWD